ncbi:MAG: LPS assembly protein LptD, partial [Pseudomonadota bacterium]|nr:LPS assembly protein LptD [Pseudomonadota bacterium]
MRPTLALALLLATATPAAAQFAALTGQKAAPVSKDEPVTFQADRLTYDRDSGIVTATGNVEAWQNDHVLRADTVTYDRNTNVAAATGHVALLEPDGQVLFSDYAELTGGLREGVLKGIRARLAANGRLVANGARRTGGLINELSRIVYTTCNLCKEDPSSPPLWDIRATSAVQDGEKKRIEYRDATLDIYGYPVAYFPYFWHADPSVKRESGFLVPSIGSSSNIGVFAAVPYYWVLDNQSDVTFTPLVASKSGPNLTALYRRRFNDGTLRINGAFGRDQGKLQGDIFARGNFSYNDTWRYGFDIQRASSATYLRDLRTENRQDVLSSRIFLEGFGVGAYSRLDSIAFQGLTSSINQSRLPYVLPRYQYDFFGQPDALGGRFSFETQDFNVTRAQGTNTQRLAARLNWERPYTGSFGEVYKATLRADTAAYQATSLNDNPNFSSLGQATSARAQPQAALEIRLPLVHSGDLGNQLVEPIAQVIAAPNTGGYRDRSIPNEDSQDFEFTDQNLFSLNRYPGLDRQEGGVRLNTALHGSWGLGQANFDALVGESFRLHRDDSYLPGSGL